MTIFLRVVFDKKKRLFECIWLHLIHKLMPSFHAWMAWSAVKQWYAHKNAQSKKLDWRHLHSEKLPSFGIMGVRFRAPLKPLNAIVLRCFLKPLNAIVLWWFEGSPWYRKTIPSWTTKILIPVVFPVWIEKKLYCLGYNYFVPLQCTEKFM